MTEQTTVSMHPSAPWYFRAPVVMLPVFLLHMLPVHWTTTLLCTLGLLFAGVVLRFELLKGEGQEFNGKLELLGAYMTIGVSLALGALVVEQVYEDVQGVLAVWQGAMLILTMFVYLIGLWNWRCITMTTDKYTRAVVGGHIYRHYVWPIESRFSKMR